MKKLLLVMAFLVAGLYKAFIPPAYSQVFPGDSIKPLPQVNKEFLVIAHIVLSKDTVAEITQGEVANVLAGVSAIFSPIGISFTLCQVDSIYNFQYNALNKIDAFKVDYMKEVYAQYNVQKRINMYFMSEFINDNAPYCGFATLGGINVESFENSLDKRAIVIKKGCNTVGTVTHEMGHFFNLEHTFGSPTSPKELVNGNNCDSAGDRICDTPADPYEENSGITYLNTKCEFIYMGKDANGEFYDPDISNVMSYYSGCKCPNFTHGQYKKMADYYLLQTPKNPSISW